MESTELKHLAINDIEFLAPSPDEAKLIANFSKNLFLDGFKKRFLISILAAILIIIAEWIGRMNLDTLDTMPGVIILVVCVAIIYNIISFVYCNIKTNMNDILNKSQCIEGVVSEKYTSSSISKNKSDKIPNYILFDTGNIHCVTAIPTKDKALFCRLRPGDEILVLKMIPMGNTKYSFISKK